ncbi:hypothetical protein F4811DRAFT_563300 [Daldinia bambusicola]|nr:hypothetical protein F4811DRAFT_563300 [Daldinia bambusicola]
MQLSCSPGHLDCSRGCPLRKKRRPHRKSRSGCRNCKNRKVKCDEVKPTCSSCTRFSLHCDFSPLPLKRYQRTTRSSLNPQLGRERENWTGSPEIWNVDDLELMYHFMLDDGLNIGSGQLWREEALHLGFKYHCILHLALALSALQLASLTPSDSSKYEKLAGSHSALGLRLARDLLLDLNKENGLALYFATTLVCFVTLGKRLNRGHFLTITDGWEVAWWDLFQGVHHVVEKGGIKPIFGPLGVRPEESEKQQKYEKPVLRVVHWELPLREIEEFLFESPHYDLGFYQDILDDLSRCFRETYGTIEQPIGGLDGKYEVVIAWLYRISDDFAAQLKDGHPIALIILAHYAVLFSSLEYVWCLRGWAREILSTIKDMLEREFVNWLKWPLELVEEGEALR